MKYMLSLVSLLLTFLISINICAMHSTSICDYGGDFVWFLQTQLNATCNEAHGDNQSLEFYSSVTTSLQHKNIYDLLVLLQTSSKFVRSTPISTLARVKQTIHTFIYQALEQAAITPEDIRIFSTLKDTQFLKYVLKILQSVRDKVTERQRFMYNKLILTLHIQIQLLVTMRNKRTLGPAKSIKASIATRKGRPSTDMLYQEIENEMTSSTLSTAPQYTPEYTVTFTTPLASTTIMQDYTEKESTLCMQPLNQAAAAFMQELHTSKEALVTHTKQKKALEETGEQLRSTINQNVQHFIDYLDTTSEKLLILEQERTRLLDEERELLIERELLNKRLDAINKRIMQLNTLENTFKHQH